jgi:A/G-specific adenine glycosylase
VTQAVPLAPDHVGAVQSALLAWYARHGRDLPWRRTRDPYAILVAEVMLQQTQVDRIAPRWEAWLEQFPTLRDLAGASRADVIRAWQGLGYNLRAVRLHEIARQVTDERGGTLPRTLDGLLALRGIGRYTAGAVACFAYEQPVSMVDTNVRRVLGRVFAPLLSVDTVAELVLPRDTAYAWNQALMDVGATLCRADRPLCLVCPLLKLCKARASGQVGSGSPRARATQPPFRDSSRYFRGRIVDLVRGLPSGGSISFADVQAALDLDTARLERLVARLAADGLIAFEPSSGLRLPP